MKTKSDLFNLKNIHQGSLSRWRLLFYVIIGIIFGYCSAKLLDNFLSEQFVYYPRFSVNNSQMQWHSEKNSTGNSSRAYKLFKEVRILCWILTNPKNHRTKAIHVQRTWGKRCNKLLFMSSKKDIMLDSIALPVQEGRAFLWSKTKMAFQYIYEHHINDADWFFKADDDTYAVMENMRYLLQPYSPKDPIYFGCRFKKHIEQGYMSGGAGYVLSKEAVRRFVQEAIPNDQLCLAGSIGDEDLEIGKCLENVNVRAVDSRDSLGRGRFFPFDPISHLVPHTNPDWYWDYLYYESDDKHDCCSTSTISFHYINAENMYLMDYFIYLKPFGLTYLEELPKKINWNNKSIQLSSDQIN